MLNAILQSKNFLMVLSLAYELLPLAIQAVQDLQEPKENRPKIETIRALLPMARKLADKTSTPIDNIIVDLIERVIGAPLSLQEKLNVYGMVETEKKNQPEDEEDLQDSGNE